ncbi:MAG: RidA family protein [Steroidobacteraceae bacterium]|jgi:reactive intermediate/imine deaminase
MASILGNRRNFAARLASLFAGLSVAEALSASKAQAKAAAGPQKLDYEGKSVSEGYITPLIINNGVIYVAGQGAHSHDATGTFAMDIDTHTRKVMENIKTLVEAGGGAMDSILQLTVFLTKIEDFEGMNKVFKTYFPHGGPARTTVAVAALPGQSLVEINCTAAVLHASKKVA